MRYPQRVHFFLCLSLILHSFGSPTPVGGGKVARESLRDTIKYPGRILSAVEATVLSEMDGVVQRISVQLGQTVRRGQALFEVIQTDPIYQFRPFRVTSPVDGTVGSIDVSLGSRIARGQKLAFVMDPKKIKAQIELVADHVSLLPVGTNGFFRIGGQELTDKTQDRLPVTLVGVSPMIDSVLGTAVAQLEFSIPPQTARPIWLRPGVVGQVVFEVRPREAFKVKEEALIFEGDQPLVRVVEEGKIRRVKVRVGAKANGFVEILEGIEDGMWLVERAPGVLKDGQSVTVQ